ncbi:hypothetical protein ACQ4PT_039176 [Festuca glaucescens]
MASPLLLGLLLIPCVVTAGGDDGARDIPHLELPGTSDSARGHASDGPPQWQLMDIMSRSGCGRFATLVAATPNVSDVLQQLLVPGGAGAGGLTVFCPDDKAVAAFEPTFRALAESDRLDVLLHHAAAARYDRAQLAPFACVEVRTLAVADKETVLVRDRGGSIRLWLGPTWPRDGQAATVTKTISSEEHPLVLYVVDAVLLRQKLDGGDEAAACGVLDLLRCCWPRICVGIGAGVLCRIITDVLVPRYRRQRPIRA